jgi:hypothetical protein
MASICILLACDEDATLPTGGAGASGGSDGGGGSGGGGGTAGTGGTAGAGGTGGAAGMGGSGGAGGEDGVCDPPLSVVPPTSTDDVLYDFDPTLKCFEAACFCEDEAAEVVHDLLACDPMESGFFWSFGALRVRVRGREAGECVYDVGREVEGGVAYHRCRLPLPVTPWAGLATTPNAKADDGFLEGIEDQCELIGSCCILDDCPNPCAT